MNKMEAFIYYNDLYDLYGNLLNDREREIFSLYHGEDFSLQEIADYKRVSKSAIGRAITTIHTKLDTFEEKLHFLEKKNQLLSLIFHIQEDEIKIQIEKILGIQ